MMPDAFPRVFRDADDEKKSAKNHQKDDEHKSSARIIGGSILVAH
jgi:hypothetical protein